MIYGQLAVGLMYKHYELMFGINYDKGPLLYKQLKIRPIHVSTTALQIVKIRPIHVSTTALQIVKIRPIDASLYHKVFY